MSNLNKDLMAAREGSKDEVWAMMVKNRLEHLFLEDRAHVDRYGLHASAILASDMSSATESKSLACSSR